MTAGGAGDAGPDDLDDTIDRRADDATLAVNDATIVVNEATIAVNEATIAVNNRGLVDDSTVVVAGDATVAAPAGRYGRRGDRPVETSASGSVSTSASVSASVALPVEEPPHTRSIPGSTLPGSGLDPDRPIALAPGTAPWEALPTGERGVTRELPVSYGARHRTAPELQLGVDEVQRRLGPAPQGHPVQPREGREALPSLERRDRRRRLATLALYAAALTVCVLGLIGVASLVFG